MALGFWAKDYLGPKEAGGGGGVIKVPVIMDETSGKPKLGISAADLFEAVENGSVITGAIVSTVESGRFVNRVIILGAVQRTTDGGYTFHILSISAAGDSVGIVTFSANGPDEYPTMSN